VPRYLDPRNPLLIKKVFADHLHLLKSFLNAVLPLPLDGQIETLEHLYPEQAPQIPVLKRPIIDVKCTDQKGRIFLTEMQMEWSTGFMQRMLFNSSQAYIKQLKKGENYHSLCPVYSLAILNERFDKSASWYHHYQIVNVEQPKKQLEGLEFVFVELPKFKPATWHERKLAVLWLRFLSEIPDHSSQVPAELLAVPELREACELSEESAYTEAELMRYQEYWDLVSRERTLISGFEEKGLEKGLAQGRAEGHAEGRTEGLVEGQQAERLAIARQLKHKGFGVQAIADITGLSSAAISALKP
jgi:predicted transposase/invertase (TIGR01784 family)